MLLLLLLLQSKMPKESSALASLLALAAFAALAATSQLACGRGLNRFKPQPAATIQVNQIVLFCGFHLHIGASHSKEASGGGMR